MLDSRAVGGGKKTGIQAAASRSSVFLEHMSEMEDTVSLKSMEIPELGY